MKASGIALAAVVIPALLPAGGAGGEERKAGALAVSSPAFAHRGAIPREHTCDGADVNPPLSIRNVPEASASLALIVEDPDAPGGTWVHWLVWNIGPKTMEIPARSVPGGARQGTNDFGKRGYGGPCPPSGTHRYVFRVYALDAIPALPAGAPKDRLEEAMKGHIIGMAELVGLYRRR